MSRFVAVHVFHACHPIGGVRLLNNTVNHIIQHVKHTLFSPHVTIHQNTESIINWETSFTLS